MRCEAETLLKYIGNDREINTFGGLIYLALGQAIKTHSDPQGLFASVSLEKDLYKLAMIELVPFFDQMSEHAFSRLMGFTHVSCLNQDRDLGLAMKTRYPRHPRSYYHTDAGYNEHIAKRAEFIQNFSGIRPPLFDYSELEREVDVRLQQPWRWISAVLEVNPDPAIEEIVTQITKTQNTNTFRWKIAYFVHRMHDGEAYLKRIMDLLNGKIPAEEYDSLAQHIATSVSLKGKV